jgi:hypothetical protein
VRSLFDVSLSGLSAADWVVNGLVGATTVGFLVFFAMPRVRSSSTWRATVTPLASIIGSGFLVVAPLLGFTVGRWAVVAMVGIVGLAYLVGGAVRYNIVHVEDLTESYGESGGDHDERFERTLRWASRMAKVVLAGAYVVAVTFYLELLGAFVLRLFGTDGQALQKGIASALLVSIGSFGLWRGLRLLESVEKYAVELKLSIIGGLLVGLAFRNGELLIGGQWGLPTLSTTWDVRTVRELMGTFLIVQGFETSRYLRGVYEPENRVRTMRYAQLASAAIYLVFVGLATVMLDVFSSIEETGIIDLSHRVAFVLPILLVVGAVMSQFSAAVADTIGSGGLVQEVARGKIDRRYVYAVVAGLSLVLLWSAHILVIIAYASRAFALYYAIQCAMAAAHAFHRGHGGRRAGKATLFGLLAILMLATAIFGIPAESAGGSGR